MFNSVFFLGREGFFWFIFTPIFQPWNREYLSKNFLHRYSMTVWLENTSLFFFFLKKKKNILEIYKTNILNQITIKCCDCFNENWLIELEVKVCDWHWSRKITVQMFAVTTFVIWQYIWHAQKLSLKTVF